MSTAPNPLTEEASAALSAAPPPAAASAAALTPMPAPQGGGGGAAAAPAADDAAHSRVGRMFHSVLDTLGGGATEPTMDAQGQITDAPVHRTGGDWARRLLAGALTGLGAGAEAPVRRGAGALTGLGAGALGETAELQEQEARKKAQLQGNFANQQKAKAQEESAQTAQSEGLLRQAQTAYLTTQNTSLGFELTRQNAEATDKATETFNTFQKAIAADDTNQDLGVFRDMGAVLAYEKNHPELTKQIAGHGSGQIVAVPNVVMGEDGQMIHQGVRAALVRPDVAGQTLSQVFGDQPVPPIPYFVPGKMQADGKQAAGQWLSAAPAAGTRYGDYLTALQKASGDAAKENGALATVEIANKQASTGAEIARAGQENAQAELTRQQLGTGADELGRPLPALPQKEREKRYDTFTKDYVDDKNKLEQSYQQMNSILARAADGKMTGADSVVGLFNAIGISSAPLKGRGFRVNKDVVGEHAGARNVFQSAAAGLSKLTPNGSGEMVTPKQLRDYTTILQQARHDLYVTMGQEADRQGLPKDFLPKPQAGGGAIDAGTMKIFLDVYGGNPALAAQSAGKLGWGAPAPQGGAQ